MARASAIGINESQFLHVAIDVPSRNAAKFVALMPRIIPLFTRPCPASGELTGFAWTLVAAMKRAAAGHTTRFLHLWKMNDPARPLLSEVMEACGADNSYGALDALVNVEVQDLMHSNDSYSPANWPAARPSAFVHETLDMTGDVAAIVQFENAIAVVAEEADERFGWTLRLAVLANTGRLRRYRHFWSVTRTDAKSIAAATTWLMKQPTYKGAIRTRTADVFEAVTYPTR